MWTICLFELRQQMRHPAFGVLCLTFFALAVYATAASPFWACLVVTHVGASANVIAIIGITSAVALYACGPLLANSLAHDLSPRIASLLLSLPFSPLSYVGGKLFAGVMILLLPTLVVTCGLFVGSFFAPPGSAGLAPATLESYLYGLVVLALPNACFAAAFLLALACATRSAGMTYFALLVMFVLYALSIMAPQPIAGLIDPFGTRAFAATIKVDHRSATIEQGFVPLLNWGVCFNRSLWLSLSLVLLACACRFLRRPAQFEPARFSGAIDANPCASDRPKSPPVISRSRSPKQIIHPIYQCLSIATFTVRGVLRSWPFWLSALIGVLFLSVDTLSKTGLPIPTTVSVTQVYVEALTGNFQMVVVMVLAYFAMEMTFADVTHGVAEVTGTLPVTSGCWALARQLAIASLSLLLVTIGVMTCALWQGIRLPEALSTTALANCFVVCLGFPLLVAWATLAAMTAVKDRRYAILIVAVLLLSKLAAKGVTPLLNFGWLPPLEYSDLIGFGAERATWVWYFLYWVFVVATMHGLAMALSHRRGRVGASWPITTLAIVAPCAIALGIATTAPAVTRQKELTDSGLTRVNAAAYEHNYRHLAFQPQPSVVEVTARIDVFPQQQHVKATGTYHLVNRTNTPISTLLIDWNPTVVLTLGEPAGSITWDRPRGFAIVHWSEALQPGQARALEFTLDFQQQLGGLTAEVGSMQPGGTLLSGGQLLPRVGYAIAKELSGDQSRAKFQLGESSLNVQEDPKLRAQTSLYEGYGGRANLDLTLSTVIGETIIAPGVQRRSWSKAGRYYARFVTDTPVIPNFEILSGTWVIEHRQYHDVTIQYLHNAKHPYNEIAILDAAAAALAYGTHAFGDYPYHTLDIVEVPRQQQNPEAFPGLIVLPENAVPTIEQGGARNWVVLLVSHEVAHQWWAYGQTPAYARGADVLTETLAQYTALRVIHAVKGGKAMAVFLDDAQREYTAFIAAYPQAGTLPLSKSFHDPYLAYKKGAIVFDQLVRLLGEDRVNADLARVYSQHASGNAPFPLVQDLEKSLQNDTTSSERESIIAMFDGTETNPDAATKSVGKQ